MKRKIKFNTIEDVKNYICKTIKLSGDVVIKNEKYVVNGKSLMGIFSLNLENELDIEFTNLSEKDMEIIKSISLIY